MLLLLSFLRIRWCVFWATVLLTNKPLYVLETKHSSDSRAQIVGGKDAPRSCHEGSSWWQGGPGWGCYCGQHGSGLTNLGHWVKDTVAQVCLHLRDSVQISLPYNIYIYISINNIIQYYYVYNTVYIYFTHILFYWFYCQKIDHAGNAAFGALFCFLQKNHEATQGCFNKLVGIEV